MDDVAALFRKFDADGIGKVSKSRLLRIFQELMGTEGHGLENFHAMLDMGGFAGEEVEYEEFLQYVFTAQGAAKGAGAPQAVRLTELPLLRDITLERHVSVPAVDSRAVEPSLQALQPTLVRGHTGHTRGDQALANLVADALAGSGWAGANRSAIVVKDNSGHGGSKTYKVTCKGCTPESVALHSRSEATAKDSISESRMEAAADVFSRRGFGPRRLAYGGDWFIEAWEGEGSPDFSSVDRFREFGAYLAKIHEIPKDWFEPWREKLCARNEQLRSVPHGSHVWWFSARQEWFNNMSAEHFQAFLSIEFLAPTTALASRVVTTHGDLHPGNMLDLGAAGNGGLACIDFEFTNVSYAAYDLGYTLGWIGDGNVEKKRAFIESYVAAASGMPAPEADVDEVFIDASIQDLCFHWSPLAPWRSGKWFPALEAYSQAVALARRDPELRAALLRGERIFELFDNHPKLRAIKLPIEVKASNERMAKLQAMPQCEARQDPVALVDCGHVQLDCQADRLTVAFWLHAHDFQKYLALPVLSTGIGYVGQGQATDAFGELSLAFQALGWDDFQLVFRNVGHVPGAQCPYRSGTPIAVPLDGAWHHCAVVGDVNEQTIRVYVDGALATTDAYAAMYPFRLPAIGVGTWRRFTAPMAKWQGDAAERCGKRMAIRIAGHPDESYNGVYFQQEGLINEKPFFKNSQGRFLKKYDALGGGGPDWSLDHRQPEDDKDWCDAAWYGAPPGEDLMLGTFRWNHNDLELTTSWGEAAAGSEEVTFFAMEDGEPLTTHEFAAGQLADFRLYSRCLEEAEVASLAGQPPQTAPPPRTPAPQLEKVELATQHTWAQASAKAAEMGGALPTRLELILAAGQVQIEDKDTWVPVRREDELENDWVETGKCHRLFCGHQVQFSACPRWGTQTDDVDWRPLYFYMVKHVV